MEGDVDDELLIGVLDLLATLVSAVPQLRREEYHGSSSIIEFLLQHCLFAHHDTDAASGAEAPTAVAAPVSAAAAGQPPLPKCKRPASRSAAFALLSALCVDNEHNLRRVVENGLAPLCARITKVRGRGLWVGGSGVAAVFARACAQSWWSALPMGRRMGGGLPALGATRRLSQRWAT